MNEINQSLETQLKQSEQRAHQQWYADGLAEIVLGAYFLLLALLYFVDYAIAGIPVSALGLPIIVLGGVFALAPIVRRLKARLTHSRSGFVSYKEPSTSRRLLALILGLAVGLGVGILVVRLSLDDSMNKLIPMSTADVLVWLPVVQGMALAIVLGYMAYRFAVVRYYLLAGISLLTGFIIVLAQLSDVLATAVYFFVMGTILIIVGLITLRTFLHQTEPYQEEI